MLLNRTQIKVELNWFNNIRLDLWREFSVFFIQKYIRYITKEFQLNKNGRITVRYTHTRIELIEKRLTDHPNAKAAKRRRKTA